MDGNRLIALCIIGRSMWFPEMFKLFRNGRIGPSLLRNGTEGSSQEKIIATPASDEDKDI